MSQNWNSKASPAAVFELVFAGSLWGFGFVAAVWALRIWGPMTLTALRFGLALVVGYSISILRPELSKSLTWKNMKLAFIPGCLLSATLLFQTWGLQYTTATKSSFITCFYVLTVPVLERIWLRRLLPKFHLLFVLIALLGLALICDVGSIWRENMISNTADLRRQQWNIGDLLTLACATAASAHILWFGMIHERIESPFVFNLSQTTWAIVPAIAFSLFEKNVPRAVDAKLAVIGLCFLAIGSTMIAFTLQIRAQKSLSPSLAALLFLLESPFATLFAICLLGETLRLDQALGAALILFSVIATTILHQTAFQSPPPQ